ncbi:MAG: class I SAM-dependent methyltransferase [Candidatus Hydrogenedentota bacterium]
MTVSEGAVVHRSAGGKILRFLADLLIIDYVGAYRANKWRGVRNFVTASWRNARIILKSRNSKRAECPCCGWTGFEFLTLPAGCFIQDGCICIQCGAQQRHRALRRYLDEHDAELRSRDGLLLHTAPEPSLGRYLDARTRFARIGADIEPEKLRVAGCPVFRTDLRTISLPSNTVDAAFCLHVLEHICEDKQAIAELHRVLKPDGIAYFMVPMMPSPLQDTEEFGCARVDIFDHWRTYGLDFKGRLEGFEVEQIWPKDYLSDDERIRYGVGIEEIIHRCVKR